jgi:hypothetical protein
MLEDRRPLGTEPFQFRCHKEVSCFLHCCRKVELRLFPYDILRLKQRIGIHSASFLEQHTRLGRGAHPFFPAVLLNMRPDSDHACPFLAEQGCSIYADRPSACRTYPLERAVEKTAAGELRSHYFLVRHPYCQGHLESQFCTVKQWEREQRLAEFNLFNSLWAEVDALFAANPWQGEGYGGPLQQLAFMICYNIDAFRDYVREHDLLSASRLNRDHRRRIEQDDSELLKFGFDWLLRHVFAGPPSVALHS